VTVGGDGRGGSTPHADKTNLGFVGGSAVHEGPGGGLPFPQHLYDAAAAALARGLSLDEMQVNVRARAGMQRRTLLKLAKKVKARGRVPGRHGVHRNHVREVHAHHVNLQLQRMRKTEATAMDSLRRPALFTTFP
jgi:hypothetical protein